MALIPYNPDGVHLEMSISVGALKVQDSQKARKFRTNDGLAFGVQEYFHGIPPQWKYIDEKYFEQWEKHQQRYKKRLLNIQKLRKQNSNKEYKYYHNLILCKAGPEWYQELSPQQKDIIDNLKFSIKKDLDSHLTKVTQSQLSLLGMRPLPNDCQLWNALRTSFGCPIEFLLVLYQLIKPQRTHYSLNDRLLLSGVAHLCLKDTLREMHARFPSPPRIEKEPKPPKPEKPKKKYGHVYLIPFTYKWPQRRTDEYRNPVIQKPESPYFSYICNFEKVRYRCFDGVHHTERADEDIKIPCELFDDHREAEAYYNLLFRCKPNCQYTILRPRFYQTPTPKTYPAVLPKFMLKKRYPQPIKIFVDVKIYDEVDPKTSDKKKVIRTTCEAKTRPDGRPGQKLSEHLVSRYVYKKDITGYLAKIADPKIPKKDSEADKIFPCSICGGPKRKKPIIEAKPIKVKSWIKRPRVVKKKPQMIEHKLSDFVGKRKRKEEVVTVDERTRRLQEENKRYIEGWEKLFASIEKLEKLKIETGKCVCPDRTRDKSKTKPEIDCTCAIWNLPPPPKVEKKISCECDPRLEEEYAPIPPKCECKAKAIEKALEACEKCGKQKGKPEIAGSEEGVCQCTKILDACGNCVKVTPMKFPLMEGEEEKECGCTAELRQEDKEFTVGYVLVDTQHPKATFCCRSFTEKLASTSTNNRTKREGETKKITPDTSKICNQKNSEKQVVEKNEFRCSSACKKLLELDFCQRETEKLLHLLKCNCEKCKGIRQRYKAKFIRAGTRDACGGIISVIGGTFGVEKECDCLETFKERVRGVSDYKKRMAAKLALKSNTDRFIISGVQQTSQGPVYNLAGVVPRRECICKTSEERLKVKKRQSEVTGRVRKGYRYVIHGVKEDEQENELILGGVKKECGCTEVYEKFMEEHNKCLVSYENYLEHMKKEVQAFTDEMRARYRDPNVTEKELIQEEVERMKGAPGLLLPGAKSSFLISGVQINKSGKSFILGSVRLNEKSSTECVVAIKNYVSSSDQKDMPKCQRAYLCNYMTFGRNCGNPFQPSREVEVNNSSDEVICQCISYESIESQKSSEGEKEEEEEEAIDGCACECPCGVEIKPPKDCTCAPQPEIEEPCVCSELSEGSEDEDEDIEAPEGCTCGVIEVASSGTASDPCVCGFKNCGCQIDEVCVKECFYGPMEAWWSEASLKQEKEESTVKIKVKQESSTSTSTYIGGTSKRYVILRKIPKSRALQEKIIQKLLNGLAKDGFPLAKLPDCHRIPYFWLWMQFRLKKRWDFKDAVRNYQKSHKIWKHIELCQRKVPTPKLPVFCKCQALNYTWRQAETVKKMVNETRQKFYGRVRKNMVDFAREFYASLSPYQYPKPAYLNHYFNAYQPGKVENVITEYVWKSHEHKNPRDYKSCFCK